jgi:amino acid permease
VQPQYLYVGDKYVLNASVSNNSDSSVSGVARLEVYASDSYEGAEPVVTAAAEVTVPAGKIPFEIVEISI